MSSKNKIALFALFIGLAAATRLFPSVTPPNVSPMASIALFGSAFFGRKYLAIILPLAVLFVSDLFLNNVVYTAYYDGFTFFSLYSIPVYTAFLLIALLGFGVSKKITGTRVLGGTILATILFFLVTNFGSWLTLPYTKDLTGLVEAYTAGLPFVRNSFLGNLFYSGVFFGLYQMVNLYNPSNVTA